jgi:molecular chaperone HscB
MDAFDVLGLVPTFELDSTALEQRYRDLQRQLHPDKFVNASSSERRESLSRAVSVNDAYRVLKDELKRAELLYTRLAGKPPDKQSTADGELLMEVMELREELAEARQKRALAQALTLQAQVSEREARETTKLKQVFSSLSANGASEHASFEQLDTAARALTRLRYYRRFHDEVAALEDDLSV